MIERKEHISSPGKVDFLLDILIGRLWIGLLLVEKLHAGDQGCENRWKALSDPPRRTNPKERCMSSCVFL